MDLWVEHGVAETARQMDRTPGAVEHRLNQIDATLRMDSGWYTVGETARTLGVTEQWVEHHVKQGVLRPRGRRSRYAMARPRLISELTIFRALKSGHRDIRCGDLKAVIRIVENRVTAALKKRLANLGKKAAEPYE